MSRTTAIGLADLALALDALAVEPGDGVTRLAVAHALGFNLRGAGHATAGDGSGGYGDGSGAGGESPFSGGAPDGGLEPGGHAPEGAAAAIDDSLPMTLEPLRGEADNASIEEQREAPWLLDDSVEEVPPPTRREALAPPTPPLLRPNWARGILQAATSLPDASGAVDIDRLIQLTASRRPVARLPRLLRPTLRHGLQLLLDESRSMGPFLDDQEGLLQLLRRLFPPEACEVLRFLESPTRGVFPENGITTEPYAPPVRPSVVLVVSDFSAAPARAEPEVAGVEDWLGFADRLADARCPFVALSPYDRRFWPPALASRADIVTWDRDTSMADALHARGGCA